jgi:DNA-binding NtrC family response regulator
VFSVYLPIVEEGLIGAESAAEYEIPDFSEAKPILVADDEEMILQPVQRFFSKHGLVVFTANDGVEAIEEFKKHQHEIGLVLLDLRMPRLSGTEAFSIIHHLNPSIIGVLMTGFGEDLASTDHIRMGLSEVVQKPFTFEDLSRVLERHLL